MTIQNDVTKEAAEQTAASFNENYAWIPGSSPRTTSRFTEHQLRRFQRVG